MIVDDELIVRVGIKSVIEWEANGFQIVGEAVDGEDALSKIPGLMPHIILTDIKMPKMDGIQLIQKVREMYREINIVVLSCHNDFEFVKQAMKLGASDYILKLSMEPEGLLKVMDNLKKQFDESSQQTSRIDFLRNKIDSNMDAIKGKFFRKVLSDGFLSTQDMFKEATELNIRFKEGVYVILATQIERNKGDMEKQTEADLLRHSILNIMGEAVNRELYGEVFPDGDERFITILTFDKDVGNFAQVRSKVEQYAEHIHNMLKIYINIAAYSGVYDNIINDTGGINSGYKAAGNACGHMFYTGENKKTVMYGELKYTAYSEEIRKLKQYIRENYNKDISLESVAGFLNVGKNYFCSIFKKETGETFFDYLINVRINNAKELLKITGLKNYEVAEKVGYSNFNYFSRLFKKVVGISPNEYKRLY